MSMQDNQSKINKMADNDGLFMATGSDDQKPSMTMNENAGIPLDGKTTGAVAGEDFGYMPQNTSSFGQVDPQAFVQRMSAGAKEAQEQLDAKFAQTSNDLNDFLGSQGGGMSGPVLKDRNVTGLTNDFMNAERYNLLSDDNVGATYSNSHYDKLKEDFVATDLISGAPMLVPSSLSATINETVDPEDTNYENSEVRTQYDSEDNEQAYNAQDSPSVSYNPSPTHKHAVTDALKEQENDKFISSEDLLGDYKESVKPPVASTAERSYGGFIESTPSLITDLDADQPLEHRDIQNNAAKPEVAASSPAAKPTTSSNSNISVTNKAPAACMGAAGLSAWPGSGSGIMGASQHQPQIISVEDIFYKYGLGKYLH